MEWLEGILFVEKNWVSVYICEVKNVIICYMVLCDIDLLNLMESSSLW